MIKRGFFCKLCLKILLISIFNYFNMRFNVKRKMFCVTWGMPWGVFLLLYSWRERVRDIMKTHYVHAWIMRVINVWINQRNPFLIFFLYSTANPFNADGEINQKYLNFFLLFWKLSTPAQRVYCKIAACDEWQLSSPKWFFMFSIFQLSIGFFLAPCTHTHTHTPFTNAFS